MSAKKPAKKRTKSQTGKMSKTKGKAGELEFSHFLAAYGITARRGQQFSGGTDSPDVMTNLTGVHFEVKRTESGNPYKWLDQAKRDGKGKLPIVAHRRNNQDWIAVIPMGVLVDLLLTREGMLL